MPTETPLDELAASYIAERNLSKMYSLNLLRGIREFSAHLGHQATTDDLIHTQINPWLDSLEKRGLADTTVANGRRMLLVLWRAAFENGEMDRPPQRIRKVRCKPRVPHAWTMEELGRLLDACERLGGKFRNLPVKRKLYMTTWVMVQFDTGIRYGDMLSLKRDSLSSDGKLTIVQEKTDRVHHVRVRELTLFKVQELIEALPGHDLIFPAFCDRRRWFRFFATVRRRAGLPKGGTKWLRRSSASYVELQRPGTAWRHLGHTRPGLDVASYLDPRICSPEATMPPAIGEYVRQVSTVDLDKLPTDARIRQILTEPEDFGAAEMREVLDYATSTMVSIKTLAKRLSISDTWLYKLASPEAAATVGARLAIWLRLRKVFDLSPDSKPPALVKDVDKLPGNETIVRLLAKPKLQTADMVAIVEYARRLGVSRTSLGRRIGISESHLSNLCHHGRIMQHVRRALVELFSLKGGPATLRPLAVTDEVKAVLARDPFEAADVRALVDFAHTLGIRTHEFARRSGVSLQQMCRIARGARRCTPRRRVLIRRVFNLEGSAA